MTDDHIESRPLIGQILIEKKLITEEELSFALDLQKKKKDLIGEILVDLGYLKERDIVVALVIQCGLPYIAVNKYTIDEGVLKYIPENIAAQYCCIPLDRVGDVLSVVMADPLNRIIKDKLEAITKCKIAPFIATKTEIREAIKKYY